MVNHPARRAHHHMHAAFQCSQLRQIALPAVDRQHLKAGNMVGVFLERLSDLNGQLTGGRQHQHLRLAGRRFQQGQRGQGECGGFAGACLRLPDHVAACQQGRNGGGLDR